MSDVFFDRRVGTDSGLSAADNVRVTYYRHPGRKTDYAPRVSEHVGTTVTPRKKAEWGGGAYSENKSRYSTDDATLDRLDAERRQAAWIAEALKYYQS